MIRLLLKGGLAIVATLTLLAQPVGAESNDTITVTIDGKIQQYDQPPVIIKGRSLVPLRGIFESLGAEVDWNQQTKKIMAKKDGNVIELIIGNNVAYINDVSMDLDVPAQLVNDRTLVPIRFIAESLNKKVDWDSVNKKVIIEEIQSSTEEGPKKGPDTPKPVGNSSILKQNISIGFQGTISLENHVIDLDSIVVSGSGGDGKVRLNGDGILYIDTDYRNNPGYNAGVDILLGQIRVHSDLKENGNTINVTIHDGHIKKLDHSSFTANTKGDITVGLQLRGEDSASAITVIKVDIP